jgi:Peptidase family C25
VVATVASWPVRAEARPDGVGSLLASGSTVRFTIDVPPPLLIEVGAGRQRVDILGYDLDGSPGAEASLVRTLLVAVPPSGDVVVRGRVATWRAPLTIEMAPVPDAIERGAAFEERYGATPVRRASAANVRLRGVSWLRNQRVAHVEISPLRSDGGAIDVAEQIEVEVQFQDANSRLGAMNPPVESHDPFESHYRDVLVNYEQGQAWRRTKASPRDAFRALPGDTPLQGMGGMLDTTTIFAGRDWARIAIPASGFYRVTFGQLRNLGLFNGATNTPIDSLRLFTWPGMPVLPENDYCDGCGYQEVAIGVVDRASDGLFNENDDYFYFHALGPNDWQNRYDDLKPDTLYLNHPYESQNYCYLTITTAETPVAGAPRRIATRDATVNPGGSEITPITFRERLHFEEDAEYFPDASPFYPDDRFPSTYFWEKWFWRSLDTGRGMTETVDAPGADTLQSAKLRVRLWGISSTDSCLSSPFRFEHLTDVSWNSTGLGRSHWLLREGFTVDRTVTGLKRSGNNVRIELPLIGACPSRRDRVAVAWFDLFYQRFFEPVANELSFEAPSAAGDYLFRVGPFTLDTPPRVFDVTNPQAPEELTGFSYTGPTGNKTLEFESSQLGSRRFRIVQDASIARLPATAFVNPKPSSRENLRSPNHRANYLVIYYDEFQPAADLLTDWRQTHNGFETLSVPISALYDQYSGGRTDPAAIRNFLRSAYLNWDLYPTFVTFLGDASYDFKNLTGRAPTGQPGTLLPSYELGWDGVVARQFATDDWLLNVNNAALVLPDFFGGRIPVNDLASALDVVRSKVILYEQSAPLGEYRNQVMLIADDQFQGPLVDGLYWSHLRQTWRLDSVATPGHLDRKRVYLHTYPTRAGATKPEAKEDIKANINNGVLMFNYIGHGSPFKLADESVFLDSDVGTLRNTVQLPIFVAASCDIGKYNDPTVDSLGELLLITPGRGAIAVISATELALSGQNANLNITLYQRMFARDPTSGQYETSLSEALLATKSGGDNSQKYQLMADAAIFPNAPRLWVDVALFDSAGVTPMTALERGRTMMFRGQVLAGPGKAPVSLDGVLSMRIEDSAPIETAPDCAPQCSSSPPSYLGAAATVFLGDVVLQGGTFQGRFVVPLEAKTGPRARLRAYASGAPAGASPLDGVGSRVMTMAAGSTPAGDVTGPRITLSFQSGSTTVRPDATLRIDLFDPSGILITGHTPQNGIIVTVDGNTTNRSDVTGSFRYAADSYQSGVATFQLPNLPEGKHTISVSAADNLAAGLDAGQHRSSQAITFEVAEVPPLDITQAYLFPNPAVSGGPFSGGTFVVDAPGDSVNVLLRLYTVSGRLIRTLKVFGGLGQIQIPWNGLDDEQAELANGLYLFKVHVNVREPDGESSPRQKADVEGRFVIVNR